MRRLTVFSLIAAGFVSAAAAAACDSDNNVGGGGAADAGGPDTAAPEQQLDASPTDSGPADAGPALSETLGTTGDVRVFPDSVQGFFLVDDTILRVSNAPECVAHISSLGKEDSNAGAILVGGSIVGSDGGPTDALQVMPDDGYRYLFPGPVFPPDVDPLLTVQVSVAGFGAVPAMGVQTLHLPPSTPLQVTAPVPTTVDAGLPPPPDDDGGPPPPPPDDDGGLPPPPPPDVDGGLPPPGPGPGPGPKRHLAILSNQPLEIRWVVPNGSLATQRVLVAFRDLAGTVAGKNAQLYCDYPVTQGVAIVPTNLLSEIRSRVGEGAVGQFTVLFGDRSVFSVSTPSAVSYIVDVTRRDSTTLHPDGDYIEAELK